MTRIGKLSSPKPFQMGREPTFWRLTFVGGMRHDGHSVLSAATNPRLALIDDLFDDAAVKLFDMGWTFKIGLTNRS